MDTPKCSELIIIWNHKLGNGAVGKSMERLRVLKLNQVRAPLLVLEFVREARFQDVVYRN